MTTVAQHRAPRDPERWAHTFVGRLAWIAYAGVIRLAHAAYDAGWLPIERAPLPVVSIGALTFGGSGKTPVTRWIARGLARRGWRVAILSRGYRGRGGSVSRRVDADEPDAERDGDEAALLAATCPDVMVIVGARRAQSARLAHDAGATIALLDDGHQHRALEHHVDVLLWDPRSQRASAARPPGLGLREPLGGARRANIVLLMDRGDGSGAPSSPSKQAPFPEGVVVVPVRLALRSVAPDASVVPAASPVHVVCAIADPGSFERALEGAGRRVVGASRFPDHHRITPGDVAAAQARADAEGAAALATTAKDAARSAASLRAARGPVLVYDLEASSPQEERLLDAITSRATGRMR